VDSLRPGSKEMERGCSEGQNFPSLKEVQCLEEEEVLKYGKMYYMVVIQYYSC